jgi:hypothetical protein
MYLGIHRKMRKACGKNILGYAYGKEEGVI